MTDNRIKLINETSSWLNALVFSTQIFQDEQIGSLEEGFIDHNDCLTNFNHLPHLYNTLNYMSQNRSQELPILAEYQADLHFHFEDQNQRHKAFYLC